MRLESCVRRDVMMDFRGTTCILYVHKHRATSPRDDECGRVQYDDECERVLARMRTDEGVHEAHDYGVPLTSGRCYRLA